MASQNLINIIIQAQDKASETAKKVDDNLRNIGKTSSTLSNFAGFDGLKTKLSNVATAIDGKLGGALTKARNHFNTLRTTVTNVGSTIKGKLGGTLDGIRNKLSSVSNGSKGLASSMSFLKGAVSMTAGMIGYDLITSMVETTRASLNARSSIQAFASRLNMSSTEVSSFQKSLDELQNTYKKIDMDVVGKQATDMAFRLGLPKQSLTELTETTAIFTDAMQRNGRSAEDSMLAMSDAMDGQFVRLKELGIGQDDLMKNGWDGDINNKTGLLHAMNKALKDQHYDVLAKSVDNLDDAWQVLSITLSNLLESILVPLTPAIVAVVTGITGAVDGIKGFVSGLSSLKLPEWLTDSAIFAAFGVAILLVGTWINATLIPAFAGATVAALDFAAALLANPLTWVVVALAAIALAIYEVGKAFGWWSNVQGMLSAVWDGINRLWSAFINHPDVQALINGLVWVWNGLVSAIGGAWNAVMQFFGITTGGNFDVVRAIIEGVGAAWDSMKMRIQMVVFVFQSVYNVIMFVVSGIQWLAGIFSSAWTNMSTSTNMNALKIISTILSTIGRIPALFSQFLLQALRKVISIGAQWVSAAKSKAKSLVTGVINYLRTLPGKAYSALMQVVNRIRSAIQAWITAAREKVTSLINSIVNPFRGVAGKISSALSGVANALLSPFKTAWSWIEPYYNKIKNALNIIPNFGAGEGYDSYGNIYDNGVIVGNVNDVTSTPVYNSNGNDRLDINHELKLTFNFENVPQNINEEHLIQALQSKTVLQAITSNPDFQSLDSKMKSVINAKSRRARGA